MKDFLKRLGMCWVSWFGSTLRDAATDEVLGRACIVVWRGRIYLFGYRGVPLRPVFLPENRVRYWQQRFGFQKAEIPDFPRESR